MSTEIRRDNHESVVIRIARDCDADAVRRLAQLDSAPAPDGRLLLAEADGALRAAYSPAQGLVIADPFHPTLHLVALLEAHAHGRQSAPRRGVRFAAGLPRRAPWPV